MLPIELAVEAARIRVLRMNTQRAYAATEVIEDEPTRVIRRKAVSDVLADRKSR